MILVIGGYATGKRTYVRSLGYDDDDMSFGMIDERPVVCDAHDLVKGEFEISQLVECLSAKDVVIMNEVGSGVVPAEKHEREMREQMGRLCNQLADRATRVVRMVCGIPQVLKG